MARYEHLPIYKKAMELSVYLEEAIKNYSRYHKYTVSAELRSHSRRILRLIIAQVYPARGWIHFRSECYPPGGKLQLSNRATAGNMCKIVT